MASESTQQEAAATAAGSTTVAPAAASAPIAKRSRDSFNQQSLGRQLNAKVKQVRA